jgi:hypothetical protein
METDSNRSEDQRNIPDPHQEREATSIKKRLFLQYLEKTRGVVTAVCEKVGISRATFYVWVKNDKEFRKNAQDILRRKPEVLEDMLFTKAMGGDVQSLKYLLDRTHPKFKKGKQKKVDEEVHIYHHKVEPVVKEKPKSLTQILWEEAARRKAIVDHIKKDIEENKSRGTKSVYEVLPDDASIIAKIKQAEMAMQEESP